MEHRAFQSWLDRYIDAWRLLDPLAIGDLLWASRSGDDCRRPPSTFADAKKEVKKIREKTIGSFCSHSDIVVAIRDGETDVVGGNASRR